MSSSTRGLELRDLVRELPGSASLHGPSVRVTGVHQDSRRVEPGDLFVARRGAHVDGLAHLAQAREQGAVAVLCARADQATLPAGFPSVLCDDVGPALAYAAAAVYGHPGFALDVVGVTGTNGKTTTTHLIRQALDRLAGRAVCATVGTVGHSLGDETLPAAHTTPEADEIARILAHWKARGAEAVAMEVSSHALALGRVLAVRFRVAAFLNLTRDHLDFHGSLEEYAAAKRRLFVEHAPGAAVVNVADRVGVEIAQAVRAPLVRISANPHVSADVVARHTQIGLQGTRFVVECAHGTAEVQTQLIGQHNVENLLVTLGVLLAMDVPFDAAVGTLGSLESAPGRLQRADLPSDEVAVYVDYAHTPDALGRVLSALDQSLAPQRREAARRGARLPRVLCVFGCGGDPDVGKRGPMGHAVGTHASLAILTSDNPRSERPDRIAAPSAEALAALGLPLLAADDLASAERGYLTELDRARAIELAVRSAQPGDLVLIAGKGHERYQQIGERKLPFDDVLHARAALDQRRGRGR